MKFETIKEKLLEIVGMAERFTGKHATLPILSNILLQVEGRRVVVRATNLDIGIEISLPVNVEEEGSVVVPGGVLASVLSGGTQGVTAVVGLVNDNIVVTTPQSKTVIKSQSPEDFPTLPKNSNDVSFTIPAKDLSRGFRSVWYSASTSSVKPELASVFMEGGGGKIVFAATDSFRLSEKTVSVKKVPEFSPILIPFRNIPEIVRVLDGVDGDVDVSFDEHQLSLSVDGIYITSRLVDGVFPDYRQVVPKTFETEVVVLKHDLVSTLKQAAVFSDKFNQVTISVNPSKKEFSVSANNADVGETIERVSSAVSGKDIEVRFNLRYITDCFQSIESDSVSLSFSGLAKPLVIHGVSDASFLYLVMPMNR